MTITVSYRRIVETAQEMFLVVMFFVAVTSVAHCGVGCTPVKDSLGDPAHNYATEIIACAATAGYPSSYSYDSDMLCRDKVDRRYGVGRYRDAGQ